MTISPMDHIALLLRNSNMTELEFSPRQLTQWKRSPGRLAQITGIEYYAGRHDILKRKRQAIGQGGKLQDVDNLPNNRSVDNQYAKMVDQKKAYMLSKPFSLDSKNKAYVKALQGVFDHKFRRKLFYALEDALNNGIAWLFPYYDGAGRMDFRRFPGYQILPFWADDEHERLDCAIRLYEVESWVQGSKTTVEKVELFAKDGIHFYQLDGETLIPDPDVIDAASTYITARDKEKSEGYNWERIPLIPIRCNKAEQPLISRVKCLQDGLNLMMSDFANAMEEDAGSKIIKVYGAGSEDLGEMRHNMALFRAIKLRSSAMGEKVDVDTLDVEIDTSSFETIIKLLKRAICENARGFDAKDERMGGNPNQMNIQSMYSDIDLDADNMEIELDASMEELLWFINQYLAQNGKGVFDADEVEFVFNRDMLVSESEAIENCRKSEGVISEKTIIAQHPWVKDTEAEMERLKKQLEREPDDYTPAHAKTKVIRNEE